MLVVTWLERSRHTQPTQLNKLTLSTLRPGDYLDFSFLNS
jgi:hypothetical protein